MDEAVKRYYERRAERLRKRFGETRVDEEGRWVTTENDHKVHINENGEPDMGNPHVIAAMKRGKQRKSDSEYLEAAREADDPIEFWMNLTPEQQKQVGKDYKEIYDRVKKQAGEKGDWVESKGNKADMPTSLKKPEKPVEVVIDRRTGRDTRTADADEKGKITLNPEQSETWSDHVFYHEMGHQISTLGLLTDVASNPGGLWGRYNRKHNVIESPDGVTINKNPDENFADMYANYRTRPEWLKEKAPDVHAYFERLNKDNPWLKQWVDDSMEQYKKAVKGWENRTRNDASDEEGRWITTENNHKVHLNEEGVPDKGNPHVIEVMESNPDTSDKPERFKLSSKEEYKSLADGLNSLDKKGIIARCKKDPKFKELVDGITLYTQGVYGTQHDIAKNIVKNGIESELDSDVTVGEMFNSYDQGDGFMKQLWGGQKIRESKSSLVGGVISMIEAINNAEPYPEKLFRIADDRVFGGHDPDWRSKKLYIPPKVGDKIRMDAPTSFTKSEDVIRDIQKMNVKVGDIIFYTLEPGARALDIENVSRFKQRESLTCGEFEVVSVRNEVQKLFRVKDGDEPNLKRFAGRPTCTDENGDEWYGGLRTFITLRQTGKTEIGKREDSADCYINCDAHFDIFSPCPRFDEDDEEGRWVTTEDNHKVHINEEGEPDKGNPYVIATMKGEDVGEVKEKSESVESRNKALKDNWLKGCIREKAERYWNFLADLPIGTIISDGVDEFEKTGDDEYKSVEYGDKYSTEDMLDDVNLEFDDFVPQIKEEGKTQSNKIAFPKEVGDDYERAEINQTIREGAKVFQNVKKNAREVYGRKLYRGDDFNEAIKTMSHLPVGTKIGNDYMMLVKVNDGDYETVPHGRRYTEINATLELMDRAEYGDLKIEPPKETWQPKEWTDRERYLVAKRSEIDVTSYRNTILGRASGNSDYEEIKKELDSYCDEHSTEEAFQKARKECIDNTKKRLPTFDDCKTTEDVADRLFAEELFENDEYPQFEHDFSVDTCVKVAKDVSTFFEKNPILKGNAGAVIVTDFDDEESNTYGLSHADGPVSLNNLWYGDIQKFEESYKRCVDTEFHTAGTTWRSVVYHEYAHQLEYYFNKALKQKGLLTDNDFSSMVIEEMYNYYWDKRSELPEDFGISDIMRGVSGYSVDNNNKRPYAEFFAEAYCEYMCSPTPRETAKVVGSIVERYAKMLEDEK